MILNGDHIKELVSKISLIENCNEKYISSASYDLSTSNTLFVFKEHDSVIDLFNKDKMDDLYEEIDYTNGYILKPKETVLLTLNEKINMPNNLCAHVRPRTSLSRLGLNINFQHINAGYSVF